jgi:hypothetical protein
VETAKYVSNKGCLITLIVDEQKQNQKLRPHRRPRPGTDMKFLSNRTEVKRMSHETSWIDNKVCFC